MSSLVAEFVTRIRKQAVGSESETTPRSDGKWSKRSSLDEDAQKDWAII